MSTFLSARIDEEINAELIAIANQENSTRTTIVKNALDLYLKNRKNKLQSQMQILHDIESAANLGGVYDL